MITSAQRIEASVLANRGRYNSHQQMLAHMKRLKCLRRTMYRDLTGLTIEFGAVVATVAMVVKAVVS